MILQAKVAVWFRDSEGEEWISVFDDFRGSLDIDQHLAPIGIRGGVLYGPLHLRIDGDFTQSWSKRAGADTPPPPEPPRALPQSKPALSE